MSSNRRQFITALLTGGAGTSFVLTALSANAFGQATPAPAAVAKIVATKISDRVAVFGGAGGNVGLVISDSGLLMIDGGLANRADEMARSIAEVSPKAVQVLLNTHYHFDHVGSNELLGAKSVKIIAHENVKKRLAMKFDNPAMGRLMEPLNAAGQPTETFSKGGNLTFGREALEYTHTPLAHTDGDAYVLLKSSNILHTGDLFWMGRYPVIDYTVGGSLKRMAEALGQLDHLIHDSTKIIPGHGPASVTRADLRQTREMWLTINDRLEAFAKQGHAIEDVLKAAPTKDFDEKVGVKNPEPFLRQAYGGVLAKR
jgi:glyoxylase-like metal-dependent hydrolase (beta-lactamase superfamily II)